MFIASLALFALVISYTLASSSPKHALQNECKYSGLDSGTYRCFMPDEGVSFFIDCMVDGTMYINPAQQGLYHYHKQNGLEMKFKLMLSAEYHTLEDVDSDAIPQLRDLNAMEDAEDIPPSNAGDTDDDTDGLESEDLTESEKQSVNLTAQYIVYGVIIFMALVFSVGIAVLIYWWCCRDKMASDKANPFIEIDETQPFIDIRSQHTIERKALMGRIGNTLHFGRMERSSVYDDIINGTGDNEDGDALIAHYGSTNDNENNTEIVNESNGNTNDGYVIAKYPPNTE